MTSSSTEILPYQMLLRVIGAHLDERETAAHLIIEKPGAFLLRSERLGRNPELKLEEFTLGELEQEYHDMLSGRMGPVTGRLRRSAARRAAPSENRPRSGYQDFLRAVGYELEEAAAYSILMAEIGEKFLLTYLQLAPQEGFLIRKRMVIVDSDARENILKVAHQRRGTSPTRRTLLGM